MYRTYTSHEDSTRTRSVVGWQGVGALWWLAAACLSQVSSALVAEVQAEATLILRAKSGEKGLSKSPSSQLFNSKQNIIYYLPSVHKIWGRVNTVVLQAMHNHKFY